MTTTENATLFLDCAAIITAALLLFGPGLQRRVKGPAGYGRLQHPSASRFRFAKNGDVKITGLSGQSGQAGDRADEL
jgi:hypothetical protein